MKCYETMHLVKAEDLNHHGTLFAARAVSWAVEAGFTAAACEYGSSDALVLRSMRELSFFRPVKKGAVVRLLSRVVCVGTTSVTVCVEVLDALEEHRAVECYITFVTVDETGAKKAHEILLDDTEDIKELRQRKRAQQMRKTGISAPETDKD